MFYPGQAEVLGAQVESFMAHAQPAASRIGPVKAIIAPHAGYQYSGPVAGSAYATVRARAGALQRVVVVGPAHRFGFAGVAVPSADALATPVGTLSVDRAAIQGLLAAGLVHELDRAFEGEHCLEVQLPFLLALCPQAQVVPLLVSQARPEQVEAVLEALWGGDETLVVISSDLSHYQQYETAGRHDLTTARAIEALDFSPLSGEAACGFLPIAGLLRRARALDLRATTVDLRNSGDTAGGRDRVVGYGAFVFEYAAGARLADSDRAELHRAARTTLAHVAKGGTTPAVELASFSQPLRAIRKTFVTLDLDGQLRGCIGSVQPVNPLVTDVVLNTTRAAREDPRFGPVTAAEAERIVITIAILSHPRPMTFTSEADLIAQLHPDVDGVILRDGGRQALFLPKVWQMLPNPVQFIRQLKAKAGLAPDTPCPGLQAFRFGAETF